MIAPRIAQVCMLAMTALSPVLTLGASIPYSFEITPSSAISPDLNAHPRLGYITMLQLQGTKPISLSQDLKVTVPYQAGAPAYSGITSTPTSPAGKAPPTAGTAQVVGIIAKFEWSGGVGDLIAIDFYVSQANAVQLKALQQQALMSTKINQLGWWIADYDQEAKKWYEAAYPQGTRAITGLIANKGSPALDVILTPVMTKNTPLYKVSLRVTPGANVAYPLYFAHSYGKPAVKNWGLVVGSQAGAALH